MVGATMNERKPRIIPMLCSTLSKIKEGWKVKQMKHKYIRVFKSHHD